MAFVQLAAGRREVPFDEQLAGLRVARDRYNALADQVREEYATADVPLLAWGQERDVRRIAQAYEKSIANLTAKAALYREDARPRASANAAAVTTVEIRRWQLMVLFAVSIFAVAAGLVALTRSPFSAPALGKFSGSNPPAPSVTIPVFAPRVAIPESLAPPHVASDPGLANVQPDTVVEVPLAVQHRASRPALHRHPAHAVLHKKISRTRKHQSLRSPALNHL
jgi:hypothetical protein